MRQLDSSVLTSSITPQGDYWMSGTVYFWEDGIRFYVPISAFASSSATKLDVVDAFRLLTAEIPNRLAKEIEVKAAKESHAVRPF